VSRFSPGPTGRWACHKLAAEILRRLIARYGSDLVIVHGDATGVDESFGTAAKGLGLTIEAHPARWHSLGPASVPMRNEEMVRAGADLCVALHRSIARSLGTKDCARKALAAGIPVYLIESDSAVPRRLSADDERLK
jgi:hypothetical protein